MTRIIITGSKGRMGRALLACAPHFPELQVVAQIDEGDELRDVIGQGDVVIDFSSHSATPGIVALCAEHKKAVVIGTTGHSEQGKSQIANFKSQIPIVLSSNFSTGVNTLFWLTRKAAEILGQGFDLEIVEMHHRLKRDAPSGTAKTLAEILAEVRNHQLDKIVRHGRSGIVGERTATEVGVHSVRGGDVVGDHTVIFAGPGERVELTHKASSRETFANGALRAAQWVVKQKAGLYDMQDVLGLV
ncbi:MAG TPA: 4-hydroxy-tetrahydrodipicolinate reductase [Candidatus Binatia bacterium]|jgi:4-hydroxy-tetrahydrodipicolinate reductase|nr:4-hydroxy-tetrahydrodipicolinate reductase [Candidatus Binatia bacterium]